MDTLETAIDMLRSTLQLGARADSFTAETQLMGALPEFNSLTVVGLIAGIEELTGNSVEDDEISADVFQTVGTFAEFISSKL